MRRRECQHSPHVPQLSVRPSWAGQMIASAGFWIGCSIETVESSSTGAFEKRMANRSRCVMTSIRSAIAMGSSRRQRAVKPKTKSERKRSRKVRQSSTYSTE